MVMAGLFWSQNLGPLNSLLGEFKKFAVGSVQGLSLACLVRPLISVKWEFCGRASILLIVLFAVAVFDSLSLACLVGLLLLAQSSFVRACYLLAWSACCFS